jgi:hypothetical protein
MSRGVASLPAPGFLAISPQVRSLRGFLRNPYVGIKLLPCKGWGEKKLMGMGRDEEKAQKRQAYRAAVSRELTIMATPRRMGRPETYTPELGRLACDKMVEFGSLTAACRACEELPDPHTVFAWACRHAEFDAELTRAWERLGFKWADQIIEIADDERLEPNDRRVKIDARKWVLSKLAAKRFGDKLELRGDPENPIKVLHRTVDVQQLTDVELDLLQRFAEARIAAQVIDNDEETDETGDQAHPKPGSADDP